MIQAQKPTHSDPLDPSFNENGVRYFPLPEIYGDPVAFLVQPDNKTLVVMFAVPGAPIIVARLNENGMLDRTFNGKGFVEVPFEVTTLSISRVSYLADGRSLIDGRYSSGNGSGGVFAVRLLSNGELDKSLNGDGQLFIPYEDIGGHGYTGMALDVARRIGNKTFEGSPHATRSAGTAAIEQSDGKIVLYASALNAEGKSRGVVLRRKSDGSPDETFTDDKGLVGQVIVELKDFEHRSSEVSGVVVQADNQVLVYGHYFGSVEGAGVYVTRLTSTGTVDGDFNKGSPLTFLDVIFPSISVRKSDGGIVVVGNISRGNEPHGMIARLNKSGTYNRIFNNGEVKYSRLVEEGNGWASAALHEENGSITVAGNTHDGQLTENSAVVTARYLANGDLDPTFNSGEGFAVFMRNEQGIPSLVDMAVMADGRIVVGGHLWDSSSEYPPPRIGGWLLRYLARAVGETK